MPDEFKDAAGEVISLLLQEEVLISKVSNGKKKYAVNPMGRPSIHNILRSRSFEGRIHDLLWRDTRNISARYLDGIGSVLKTV